MLHGSICRSAAVSRFLAIAWMALALVAPALDVSRSALGQEGEDAELKANLDLPAEAGGGGGDEDDCVIESYVCLSQVFEGDGFFFCCDKSGSMNEGNKWQLLQREVIKTVSQFSERVQFGIVFFDAGLVSFPASGRPVEATPASKSAAKAMVMGSRPGHGSCVKAGLLTALGFAERSSARRKVVIYVGDGHTTCPGHEEAAYGNETLADVRKRNGGKARINALCVGGNTADENWARRLADENGGTFRRVTLGN